MKICIVVGSFRKDSLNVQLAQIIQESLEKRAIGSMIRNDLEIPMFNQDLEFPVPDSIQSWRDSFLEADGIWFVTPEYNGQIPGSLKNLLDWMSRPMSLGAAWTDTAMRNQCATVSGIGGRNGTKSVQKLLIELLNFGGMKGWIMIWRRLRCRAKRWRRVRSNIRRMSNRSSKNKWRRSFLLLRWKRIDELDFSAWCRTCCRGRLVFGNQEGRSKKLGAPVHDLDAVRSV